MTSNTKYSLLNDRAILQISGADAATYLQGLITNDINKATEENAIYALMLTPQGKFLYEFFITKQNNNFLIDVLKSEIDSIAKRLKMYKLRADVSIEPIETNIYAIFGGKTEQGYADPRSPELGNRLISKTPPTNANKVDFSAYEYSRISLNIPDSSRDMTSNKSFPLQNLAEKSNAIDYKKGCYVGQEVTARTHYKGTLRKSLMKVTSEQPFPAIGTVIFSSEKKVGELRTSSGDIALAMLDIETAKNSTDLICGDVIIKVTD